MKNKFLVLNLLVGVFAVGCAESGYTPNTSAPVYNNGIPNYNNGMNPYNNNNLNPGMNQPMLNPMMNQQGMGVQGMYSYNMRMITPGFYLNTWRYRSCVPQRPYVGNCNQQTVRRTCPTNTTSTTTSTVVTTNTTPEDNSNLILPISWINEDAQALYERLAKEEETIQDGNLFKSTVKGRTGENIKCIVDGRESKAKNYVCNLEVRIKDGTILQQLPIGKDGQPENTSSSMHKGDLLNIGIPGEAPEVGYLTIAGNSAKYLFQKLPGEAITGKVDEAGILEAKVKTAGQVKCYKSINTTNIITECLVKIDSSKGKVLNF